MTDSEIEQTIIRELRAIDAFISRELCVYSLSGIVTLQGTVENARYKTFAQHAAGRCKDVLLVLNEIGVKRARIRRSRAKRTRTRRTLVASVGTNARAAAYASARIPAGKPLR